MNDVKYQTKRINLQAFEAMTEAEENASVSDASDISSIVNVSDNAGSAKESAEQLGISAEQLAEQLNGAAGNTSVKQNTPARRASERTRSASRAEKGNQGTRKKKSAVGILAFIFFLLTLILAGYLFGMHYNLFPDYLATYIDKAVPSADIIPERHQVRTFEMLYAPSVPDVYTELMLMRKTANGPEGYLVYAFTNSRGEVEYRAYARRVVTEYSLVTDRIPDGVEKHNNKAVSRVTDNDGTVIAVYSDETSVISVDEGFVRVELKLQEAENEVQYYDPEIINEEKFYVPEKESSGKCKVAEIPAGYVPSGAEGIEPVETYTSLFRIPVSIYTDQDGAFETYYVYYIYGSFEGEKAGFYPATEDGAVIPGGLRNEALTLTEEAVQTY